MTDDELKQIIDQITQGQHTEAVLSKLCQALGSADNQQFSLQLGKYNVNIGNGKEINIGDHTYNQWTEEAIEALVKVLRSSPIGLPQNIPHTGVINFVGRADELQLLHQKLQEKNGVAISAIAGMGGVGKTELAIQYALIHQKDYSGGICWLSARDENIGEQIVNFAQNQLGLKIPKNINELDNQVCWCWQHWPAGDVLIVLDDVNDYKLIQSYIPSANFRFRVLMTTRLQLLQPSQRVELKALKFEIAIALLESFINNKDQIAQSKIFAPKICNFLGCLPLGLELVGRYLQHKPDLSLAEMLQRLEAKRLKQQALEKSERLTSDMTAQLGVTAAFDLSWQELNPLAKDLSLFLCLFDLVPISWRLVEQCFSENDPEDLEEARDNFLVYLHLLQREGKETYKLHELIREFFQSKLVELAKVNLPEAVALKIGEITAKNPLYTTEILQKGLLNWGFHPSLKLSAIEWGKQLWIASQSWCDGLDRLSKLVMPLREDGSLPVLGVALVEEDISSCRDDFIKSLPNAGAIASEKILIHNLTLFSLRTGWYFGSTIQGNVVELPPEATKLFEENYSKSSETDNLFKLGWNNFKSSLGKPNISTAWESTFSEIVGNLSKLLHERSLPISSGSLSIEAAWHGAIYLTRKHLINSYPNHYCDPISLDDIENHLFKINQSHFSPMMQHCLNQLKIEIEACRAKGQTHLSLSPSIQIFKSSSNISHEILLDYTVDIFQQSIEGYEQVVNSLFIKLIPKLQLASILPARLVGYVIPPQHHEDSISMSWYWEPLPKGQKSHVNFSLVKDESSLNSSFPKTALFPMHLLKKTPFTKSWLGDYPVTEMVYQWLWKDLNKIGWVKGNRLENAGFPYWR